MLPKENRLSLSRNSRRFKERGRSLESPFFRLSYLPGDLPRFGFVVSGSVGKAHDRNRARRVLREVVRSRLHNLPPIEAVLIARRRILDASYEEVLASFNQALSKINLPR